MGYLRILLLGIVQGITEFLPISSDGHLVVAGRLLAWMGGPSLERGDVLETIVLHVGTLLAIFVVFGRDICHIVASDRRVIGLLAAATMPAAVSGLLLKKCCEDRLTDPVLTGAMLLANGMLLFWIGRREDGKLSYAELTYRQAMLIGLCQAAAPLPGISRSGTTILGGMIVGLNRSGAATFSFLLAIPAISGAALVAAHDVFQGRATASTPAELTAGIVVSFVVGIAALRFFLYCLNTGRLNTIAWRCFGWWCLVLGVMVLCWQLADSTMKRGSVAAQALWAPPAERQPFGNGSTASSAAPCS